MPSGPLAALSAACFQGWFNVCDSARTQRARPLCKSAVFCLRHLINHSLNDVRSEIGASCAVAAHANDDPLLSPLCVAPDRHGAKFRFKNQSNLTPLHPPFHYPLTQAKRFLVAFLPRNAGNCISTQNSCVLWKSRPRMSNPAKLPRSVGVIGTRAVGVVQGLRKWGWDGEGETS